MNQPSATPPLQIIMADQRLAQKSGVKLCILGPHGIGKTSLAWTLDAPSTLMINMEAGMLALEGWQGASADIRDWEGARDLACLIGGPDPAKPDGETYSWRHYNQVVQSHGDRETMIGRFENIFWDSISEMGRLCFQWAKVQPECFNKQGNKDTRSAYGLLGQEMIGLLRHLQHCPDKNIIVVGGLDRKTDDYGRATWEAQVEGSKTRIELPGIVDEVISMVEMKTPEGQPYRAFVCHTINPDGYPAKDRSGRLEMLEEPHLGRLIKKIRGGNRNVNIETSIPVSQEPAT